MTGRDWTAEETTNQVGGDRKVTVKGVVQVDSTSATAALVRRKPQGSNPAILLLDLVITGGGIGGSQARSVVHVETLQEPGVYSDVSVLLDGKSYKDLRVEQVLS